MTTYTALTTLPGKVLAEALGLALEELDPAPTGVGVFEVEDGKGVWEVGGYFTEKPDDIALALLAASHEAKPFAISRLEDRDWVAQVRRELTPVPAGRFVVYGAHDAHSIPTQKIGLEIEAAMAFGTGHHATTLGCLLALDNLIQKGYVAENTADIGCGTGVLAMAARKTWHNKVVAADIDRIATETARANMQANRLGTSVACVTAPGFQHPYLHMQAPFDLVFGNILARPLMRLAPQMAAHIAPGGFAILSGMLNQQAKLVEKLYQGFGFTRADRQIIGEWTTLVLRKS